MVDSNGCPHTRHLLSRCGGYGTGGCPMHWLLLLLLLGGDGAAASWPGHHRPILNTLLHQSYRSALCKACFYHRQPGLKQIVQNPILRSLFAKKRDQYCIHQQRLSFDHLLNNVLLWKPNEMRICQIFGISCVYSLCLKCFVFHLCVLSVESKARGKCLLRALIRCRATF